MDTRRRDLLRATGGALTAVVLAGCSGGDGDDGDGEGAPSAPDDGDEEASVDGDIPSTPTSTADPAPNLEITDFDWGDEDGSFVVEVTVDNVGDETESGTLAVIVTAGEETQERELDVSVDAGGSETYEAAFDTTQEAFRKNGAIDFEWR